MSGTRLGAADRDDSSKERSVVSAADETDEFDGGVKEECMALPMAVSPGMRTMRRLGKGSFRLPRCAVRSGSHEASRHLRQV